MNVQWWAISGVAFLMAATSNCVADETKVTYTPPTTPSISLQQAESTFKTLRKTCPRYFYVCTISPPGTEDPISSGQKIDSVNIADGKLEFAKDHVVKHFFPLKTLRVSAGTLGATGPVLFLNGWIFVIGESLVGDWSKFLRQLADAIVVEKNQVLNQQVSAFETVVETYRNAKVKPVPGEEVRRYEVMAEEAIRTKHFSEAVHDYYAGLKTAPWWPQGHFNTAMVLGELHSYNDAIDEMKKYLALVPDAPNARAARDQIYRWQADAKAAGSN